jgi:hypothetical protein
MSFYSSAFVVGVGTRSPATSATTRTTNAAAASTKAIEPGHTHARLGFGGGGYPGQYSGGTGPRRESFQSFADLKRRFTCLAQLLATP